MNELDGNPAIEIAVIPDPHTYNFITMSCSLLYSSNEANEYSDLSPSLLLSPLCYDPLMLACRLPGTSSPL